MDSIHGRKVAKEFMGLGLNPVPVNIETKEPLRKNFSSPFTEEELTQFSFKAIGVCTGIASGGLEALDFDLKNAEDPKRIIAEFKKRVPARLVKKLVIQKTVSGGYHFIYRCEEISSSKKLAKNSKGEAVIETRGEGGFIKCAPSDGYEIKSKRGFDDIQIITPEERVTLFAASRLLNKTTQKDASKRMSKEASQYFKRFPEYNGDPMVGVELLQKHGWGVHSEDDTWINMTRPGKDHGISAGYNKEGLFLFVFTTSQEVFETERPYNNHAIFAELEYGGDYELAYKALYQAGHGVDMDDSEQKTEEEVDLEDWQTKLEKMEFLSDEVEENTYLEQARKGEIQQGLSTGWPVLDKHFRLKEKTLDFGLGFDGVGKSVFMLNLAYASKVLHDWKWGMIMPENKTAMSRRRLLEIASGKVITDFRNDRMVFAKYLEEVRKNFFIMSNKRHYTIKEVLQMGKRLYEEYGINALLIDPYNFFKVTGNGYSHNNEILSEMRVFAETYCSIYVMAHPNSTSARDNFDANGYLTMPNKYNIQGGADFPYRVDNFFVTHRITNHQDYEARRIMQIKVDKIKEIETGGMVHGKDDYTSLIYESRHGFLGYWDEDGNNPIYNRMQMQNQIRGINPEEAF